MSEYLKFWKHCSFSHKTATLNQDQTCQKDSKPEISKSLIPDFISTEIWIQSQTVQSANVSESFWEKQHLKRKSGEI